MTETKTVVQGGFGPVPMEENSRRYIDAEPTTVPMTSYYVRRMLSGELVEAPAVPAAQEAPAAPPVAMASTPSAPVAAAGLPQITDAEQWPAPAKDEEK